jgi:hypothetical protein
MILSCPPPPSNNNSNNGTTTTRPRGMTICSSFDNIIDAESFDIMPDNYKNEDENNDEDNMFDGNLGDVLASYFLPPPPPPSAIATISPTLTLTHMPTPSSLSSSSSSSMEWNKNNDIHDNSNNNFHFRDAVPESSYSSSGVSTLLSSRTSKVSERE